LYYLFFRGRIYHVVIVIIKVRDVDMIRLAKSNANKEIALFSAIVIAKLLLFNQLLDKSSIMNIPLIASVVGSVIMLLAWTSLLPSVPRIAALYIINCCTSFIILSDLYFYRYFSDVISMPVLMHASNVASVKSSVVSLFHGYDIIFVIDLLILPIIYKSKRKEIKICPQKLSMRLLCFAASAAIGVSLICYGTAVLLKSQPGIFKSFYDRVYIVQNIGLIGFHGADAYAYLKSGDNRKSVLPEEQKQQVMQYIAERKSHIPGDRKLFGAGKGKNLIVVQVEALQQFVINRSIEGQEITPNLNKLIKESIYFDNYYTQTAGGGTSDAEFLSNVSLFPAKEGSVYIRYSGNNYYSLAKKLKGEGYRSVVMHAYKAGFWNRSVMYKTLGFDEYISKNDYVQDEIIGMGLSDKSFFRQSLDRLKNYKEPYYSFLITLTSHYPFDNDKRYYSSFDVGKYKGSFFGNYLEAIHYADEALGYFIEELRENGLLERSVLAVYGDHFAIPKDKKEELADYLGIGEMDDYNWVKQQKVPLIIRLPGGISTGINHTVGGGLDFMPTILNIMGVESNDMPMLGRDLANTTEGLAVLRHGDFITDEYISLTYSGKAYMAETGEEYPIDKLSKEKEEALRLLEYSDRIIEHNLTEKLVEYLNSIR